METNQNTVVHPSRQVPFCSDCQHKSGSDDCNHPSLPVSIINGCSIISAQDERLDEKGCGYQAINFKPKGERVKKLVNGIRVWSYKDEEAVAPNPSQGLAQ